MPIRSGDEKSGDGAVGAGLRRNWVYVMAPKNKQWTTAMDGVDKVKLEEADIPTPNDGEVLVRIHSVSLNFRDVQGIFFSSSLRSTRLVGKHQ